MVGAKVSIVTHKVQTTRARIRGVASRATRRSSSSTRRACSAAPPARPRDGRRRLGRGGDADIVVLLIEAHRGVTDGVEAHPRVARRQLPQGRPVALAINKIDRSRPKRCWRWPRALNARFPFAATFMISAERGHGVEDLRRLAGRPAARGPVALPRGPDRRPADADDRGRDHARKADAAPAPGTALQLTVETEAWEDRARTARPASTRSSMSRAMATRASCWATRARRSRPWARPAREELAGFLGRPVHLFLTVKVRENWLDEAERYPRWASISATAKK
jgi:GTPase